MYFTPHPNTASAKKTIPRTTRIEARHFLVLIRIENPRNSSTALRKMQIAAFEKYLSNFFIPPRQIFLWQIKKRERRHYDLLRSRRTEAVEFICYRCTGMSRNPLNREPSARHRDMTVLREVRDYGLSGTTGDGCFAAEISTSALAGCLWCIVDYLATTGVATSHRIFLPRDVNTRSAEIRGCKNATSRLRGLNPA